MATQALTPLQAHPPAAGSDDLHRTRLAVWSDPVGPPLVWELEGPAGELVEEAFLRASEFSAVPPLALRELIENLVHAGFRGGVISVLDAGYTVRVCDQGSGISDTSRALEPGFTTATDDQTDVIRGVGAGLPTASRLARDAGGELDLQPNLGGGLAATISLPPEERDAPAPIVPDATRALLALILELEEADADRLASELARKPAGVARELAELEHRGLVVRCPDGSRRLTDDGRDTVTGLF